jgi:hypothetical protein
LLGDEVKAFSVMDLLNGMNLPSLEHLQLFECDNWDFPSIKSFTERSGCQLKTLLLRNIRIRGSELLALLRILPTLETLEITGPFPNAVVNLVLAALTPQPELGDLVLPALRKVALTGTYLFSTDALLKMLESRLSADNPDSVLSVIDITLPDRAVAMPDLERFAALHGASFASLTCFDGERKWVRICNGRWFR